MSLYDAFQAIEALKLSQAIRESLWLFPAIEACHLLAFALMGGAIFIVDLRLMGGGLTGTSAVVVEREARPWFMGGLLVMLTTGGLLAISEAGKLYDRQAFLVKMIALACALTLTLIGRALLIEKIEPGRLPARLLAASSLGLWLLVALAGRWIGFS